MQKCCKIWENIFKTFKRKEERLIEKKVNDGLKKRIRSKEKLVGYRNFWQLFKYFKWN